MNLWPSLVVILSDLEQAACILEQSAALACVRRPLVGYSR
jgi:hypothetical protein